MKTNSHIQITSALTNNIRSGNATSAPAGRVGGFNLRALKKALVAACAAVACLASGDIRAGEVQVSDRFFLKMDGVTGGSTASGHKGEIEVMSYNLGVSLRVGGAITSTGARTAGKVDVQDVAITKPQDIASPMLFMYCTTGRHIPKVVLKSVSTVSGTTGEMEYCTVTLENVQITSYGAGDSIKSAGAQETVSMSYGKITITCTSFDANGKRTGQVSHQYDVLQNKSF